MNDIRLQIPTSKAELEELKKIYFESFPPDERRPWESVISGNGTPLLEAIYCDGRLCGLLTTWDLGFIYIEHLAVDNTIRNRGIGHNVLSLLKEKYPDTPIVLEAEPADMDAIAARRIGFYERNGFKVVDRTYIQPPYTADCRPVKLWLMSTMDINTESVTKSLHRNVYGV